MRVSRSSANKKKLAVVDDHFLFRQGLIGLLGEYKEFHILFEAANGLELLQKLKYQRPDLILLDIEMPGMNGVDATVAVKKKYPHIKIIVLSMHSSYEFESHMLRNGANAFLSKNADIDILADRIRTLLNEDIKSKKKTSFTDNTSQKIRYPILSARETEVLKLLCKEHTNREIGDILNIGQRTVDTYRKNIFSKIGARNLAGVVLYAVNHELIPKK